MELAQGHVKRGTQPFSPTTSGTMRLHSAHRMASPLPTFGNESQLSQSSNIPQNTIPQSGENAKDGFIRQAYRRLLNLGHSIINTLNAVGTFIMTQIRNVWQVALNLSDRLKPNEYIKPWPKEADTLQISQSAGLITQKQLPLEYQSISGISKVLEALPHEGKNNPRDYQILSLLQRKEDSPLADSPLTLKQFLFNQYLGEVKDKELLIHVLSNFYRQPSFQELSYEKKESYNLTLKTPQAIFDYVNTLVDQANLVQSKAEELEYYHVLLENPDAFNHEPNFQKNKQRLKDLRGLLSYIKTDNPHELARIALNATKKVSQFRLLNSLYELADHYVSSPSQPNKEKYYLLKNAWLQNQLGSAQIYSTKVIFDIPGLDLQGLAMIIRHWEKEVGPDSPEKDLIANEKEWLTDKYHYNWETLKFEQLSPSEHYRHYISKNPLPSESSLNIQSLGLVQECIARDEASRKEMRALMFFDSRHQHANEIAQGIEQFQQYLNKSKVKEGKYQTLTYDMQQEMEKRHLLSPSDALAAIIEEQKESPTIHIIKLKKETPNIGHFLNQITCLYDSPNPLLYTHGTDSEKTVSLKKQPLVLVFDETSPEAVENHYLDQNQENELEGFCSLYSRLSGICRL